MTPGPEKKLLIFIGPRRAVEKAMEDAAAPSGVPVPLNEQFEGWVHLEKDDDRAGVERLTRGRIKEAAGLHRTAIGTPAKHARSVLAEVQRAVEGGELAEQAVEVLRVRRDGSTRIASLSPGPARRMSHPIPPTLPRLRRLLENAGYSARLVVGRSDGAPLAEVDRTNIAALLAAYGEGDPLDELPEGTPRVGPPRLVVKGKR